ncbi:MAG: hypothetical protein JNM04_07990, partial [Chthonomonas sp.]|nr:hypothetical protein [Chthonomonas sp.]
MHVEREDELEPRSKEVVRSIANEWGERYLQERLLPELQIGLTTETATLSELRDAWMHPYFSLRVFYSNYAFVRRGKDRNMLSKFTVAALERVTTPDTIEKMLAEPDGSQIWEAFCQICEENGRKNVEQLNRGVISGMVELAQEIYQIDGEGSIAGWIIAGILQNARIEPQFLRIVDIRGIGPKTTSTYLRDLVAVFGIEEKIDRIDRLCMQPIDRWVRLVAGDIMTEIDIDETIDWVLAGKLTKYARRSGASGLKLNMGATYFGTQEVREPERFDRVIEEHFPYDIVPD